MRLHEAASGLYCGIMSGTSLDGIDVCFAQIDVGDPAASAADRLAMTARPVAHRWFSFSDNVRDRIVRVRSASNLTIAEICELNVMLGLAYADAVESALNMCGIARAGIQAVGLHGQTVWHAPPSSGVSHPGTLQIGDPSIVVERIGCPVVSQFRGRDIAAGGEGAPLVPFADYVLFSDATESRVILNLGGIANITSLPAGCGISDIVALDTGPANMLMDAIAQKCVGLPCDDGGKLSSTGQVRDDLLSEWLSHPYFQRTPPKSTGFEDFGSAFLQSLPSDIATADLLRTACELTVVTVRDAIRRWLTAHPACVIAGGGGVRNNFLMRRLAEELHPSRLETHEKYGIDSQEKEALAFAILAAAAMAGVPAGVPGATGACGSRRLGAIMYP